MTDRVHAFAEQLESTTSAYLSGFAARATTAEQLLGGDVQVALDAFRRLRHDFASGRAIGELMELRLITEVLLRLRWIAVDIDDDPATVERRALRVRKADLVTLLGAYKAVHKFVGQPEDDLEPGFESMIRSVSEPAAPAHFADFAVTPDGQEAYAVYRMCSTLVHTGYGITQASVLPAIRFYHMALDAMFYVLSWGSASMAALRGAYPQDWPGEFAPLIGEYADLNSLGLLEG